MIDRLTQGRSYVYKGSSTVIRAPITDVRLVIKTGHAPHPTMVAVNAVGALGHVEVSTLGSPQALTLSRDA